MNQEKFMNLSTEKVAELVRETGPKVCVFPINGTRRWFMMEYPASDSEGTPKSYLDVMTARHIELYQLFFDHGVDTLLTPIFGPDLLRRGNDYTRMAVEGMARLGNHPDFLTFYSDCGVRVRFYGDYRDYLNTAQADDLSRTFDRITRQTLSHDQHRLFFGVFAHDAVETVAALSAEFYDEHGYVPDKPTLVKLYYGEHVASVDLFIGFDKFSAFDMPLVSTGEEDLYFTVAPSPYMTQRQLRVILYDHLYMRPEGRMDYSDLTSCDWALMRDFYHANLEKTQGVGTRKTKGSFWHPLPQVELPENLKATS
jgi:tuberculosinol/isotuberculosinol synthase